MPLVRGPQAGLSEQDAAHDSHEKITEVLIKRERDGPGLIPGPAGFLCNIFSRGETVEKVGFDR